MIKILLVLLYIWKGQVTLEQKAFDSEAACIEAGQARIEEQQKDPRFDAGLFADCIPVDPTSTSK